MNDDLDEALAREDHALGVVAYGDDPDHCGDCKREAYLRLQAACEHDGQRIDVSTCGSRELLCQQCGLIREVSR